MEIDACPTTEQSLTTKDLPLDANQLLGLLQQILEATGLADSFNEKSLHSVNDLSADVNAVIKYIKISHSIRRFLDGQMDTMENVFAGHVCEICDSQLHSPALLSCGHTFCSGCLVEELQGELDKRLKDSDGIQLNHERTSIAVPVNLRGLRTLCDAVRMAGYNPIAFFTYHCPSCNSPVHTTPVLCEQYGELLASIKHMTLQPSDEEWENVTHSSPRRSSRRLFDGLFLDALK